MPVPTIARSLGTALALGTLLLTVACSSPSPSPSPSPSADASPSPAPSPSAPESTRAEFETFFRMSLRQVPVEKLDCIVEELDSSLSDKQAAEFIETLSAGSQPPRSTLEIVSAAAKTCRAGQVT